ncbi:hypothetical protein JCM33374_g6630 [Metschnikowia sp. JCM 33374]|nr:hypothetical protein JCM33374_g6630 [Metschnikowia sp. JCM 33374]
MDCSPRSWKLSPNTIPKHSEWAKLIMERSVKVLKDHNVDLDLLIAKFSTGVYFEDNRSVISDTVMKSVNILLGASSSKNTFLHLYLAIMVLIFPTILASDQEVSVASKMQLRASVNDCIRKLEDEIPTLASVDHRSLIIILRKMIHINEMTSTSVKPCHVVDVFEEMISDTDLISTKVDGSSQSSPLEQLFIKAAINAHNAYNLNTSPISSDARSAENLTHILNIGKTFQQVSLLVTRTIQQIRLGLREEDAGNDVPYQVFLLSTKLFHEITLSFPEIQQLPIPIITFIIILCATNEWQNVSFVRYASRGPDLSKETFKSWWVFSSMYQEYISVISELVALSHTLS